MRVLISGIAREHTKKTTTLLFVCAESSALPPGYQFNSLKILIIAIKNPKHTMLAICSKVEMEYIAETAGLNIDRTSDVILTESKVILLSEF